jgi:hypothetical protein
MVTDIRCIKIWISIDFHTNLILRRSTRWVPLLASGSPSSLVETIGGQHIVQTSLPLHALMLSAAVVQSHFPKLGGVASNYVYRLDI